MFKCKQLFTKVVKFGRSYSLFGCKTPEPNVPSTKLTSLVNGMRVATEETDSPLVCVALFVEAGPAYEKPTNYGITHFIEHMAYRGFKSMSKQQLEDYLNNAGVKMSALTTREYQVFSGVGFLQNVADIVSILSKVVTELELSDKEIEMAKYMINLESIEQDSNPKAIVSEYLHETAFQCTPLGRRIIGPSRNIESLKSHDVELYMKENYNPPRFVLATSGAVIHERMVACVQSAFGNMQVSQTCGGEYSLPQRFTGSQIAYRDDSLPFVHVAVAVEAPAMRDRDYIPMLLASNIIGAWNKSQGGNNRHGSPLARASATANLCDNFEPFYIPYGHVGLWGVYMISDKLQIDDMIINLQDRWMHLCNTTIFNDVERGINATKVELAKKIQGSVKSCYDIGTQVLYNCSRRSLVDIYEALSKLNENKIKKVASEYLYDKCPAVAAVGPTEALPEYTRIRAGMYWLRL